MRASIHVLTGKLIEAQSNDKGPLSTLFDNAIKNGYKPEEIEVKVVTDQEFEQLLSTLAPPPETEDQRFERLRSENPLLDALINALEEKGTLTVTQIKGKIKP